VTFSACLLQALFKIHNGNILFDTLKGECDSADFMTVHPYLAAFAAGCSPLHRIPIRFYNYDGGPSVKRTLARPSSPPLQSSSFPPFHPSPAPNIQFTPTNSNPHFPTHSLAPKLLLSTNSSPPTSSLLNSFNPSGSRYSRNKYLCGLESSLGPGARYCVSVVPCAAAAPEGMRETTQWRQYANFGSSGVGASGSTRRSVYVVVDEVADWGRCKSRAVWTMLLLARRDGGWGGGDVDGPLG
jgi:hypothetical protein